MLAGRRHALPWAVLALLCVAEGVEQGNPLAISDLARDGAHQEKAAHPHTCNRGPSHSEAGKDDREDRREHACGQAGVVVTARGLVSTVATGRFASHEPAGVVCAGCAEVARLDRASCSVWRLLCRVRRRRCDADGRCGRERERTEGHTRCPEYAGHNYTGHNYIGRNTIGHGYIGHNYVGVQNTLHLKKLLRELTALRSRHGPG